MMNERQKAILNTVIEDFIETAIPVASSRIVDKYEFPYSPATVRNDFLELDEEGYLYQPHTSAGRIPTDKGYRFYVDKSGGTGSFSSKEKKVLENLLGISDGEELIREMARTIASLSNNVVCAGFLDDELFYKSGFAEVLDEPEFDNGVVRKNFAALVDDIDDLLLEMIDGEISSSPRVFIGNENPLKQAREYSMIISSFASPRHKKGVISIIGPKRMHYQNNMLLLRALKQLW